MMTAVIIVSVIALILCFMLVADYLTRDDFDDLGF